jgi:hypothetical protein
MLGGSSDDAIREIERRLPARWGLNSISVTEIDEYAVLLGPRGPVPLEGLGRVVGVGDSVRAALHDALANLNRHLAVCENDASARALDRLGANDKRNALASSPSLATLGKEGSHQCESGIASRRR